MNQNCCEKCTQAHRLKAVQPGLVVECLCPCHSPSSKPYNQTDHTHCWESKNPPCGQKIEHLRCCLCELLNPNSQEKQECKDPDCFPCHLRFARQPSANWEKEANRLISLCHASLDVSEMEESGTELLSFIRKVVEQAEHSAMLRRRQYDDRLLEKAVEQVRVAALNEVVECVDSEFTKYKGDGRLEGIWSNIKSSLQKLTK